MINTFVYKILIVYKIYFYVIIKTQNEIYDLKDNFDKVEKIDLSDYKLLFDNAILTKISKCKNLKFLKIKCYGFENLDELANLQKIVHFEIIDNNQRIFLTKKKDKCIITIDKILSFSIIKKLIDSSYIKYITIINYGNYVLDELINYLQPGVIKLRIFSTGYHSFKRMIFYPDKLNLPSTLINLEFYVENKLLR